MRVIDFHTHAFPDNLAKTAIAILEEEGNIDAYLDGTISSLLSSMDRAGISVSVVSSIATKPHQFNSIIKWSKSIQSSRIVAFPSVHPDDPWVIQHILEIREVGFKGLKLHPYYQDFYLDEDRMMPIYECIEETGLILLAHTGYDIAFERIRRADPERTLTVHSRFPNIKFVSSHMGAWQDWAGVERFLLGRNLYMDTSFAIGKGLNERARQMLLAHPKEYLLFGTDSPWDDQKTALSEITALGLDEDRLSYILHRNAELLLEL